MASQIIELGARLFDSLLRSQSSVRNEIWHIGFDTPRLWRTADPRSILFEVDVERYQLGHRPISHRSVIALAVVSTGAKPCIWPRPLPDDKTIQLLETVQPILESGDGLPLTNGWSWPRHSRLRATHPLSAPSRFRPLHSLRSASGGCEPPDCRYRARSKADSPNWTRR